MYKIGLIGKMGAGKTYVSDSLVASHGGERMAFADALKRDVIGFKLTEDGNIEKRRDRRILQDYGQFRRGELTKIETPTANLMNINGVCYIEKKASLNGEVMRNYTFMGFADKDYWVRQLVENASKAKGSVIVDDIRRANEATALAEAGFVIIKLQCPDEIRFARLKARDGSFDPSALNNISETEVDSIPFDFEIVNDGTTDPVTEIGSLTTNI